MNIRIFHLLLATVIGFVFWQLMILCAELTVGTTAHRIFDLLGGSSGIGILKLVIYVAFVFAIIDLFFKFKAVELEHKGFESDILPVSYSVSRNEMMAFLQQPQQIEGPNTRFVIAGLIQKLSTHFISSNNTSDTIRIMEIEIANQKSRNEGRLEITRYIIQGMPMLGFCASILELSHSLTLIDSGNPSMVREAMSGAFDTTLISLALTLILMYFYHRFIEVIDVFFSKTSSFIIEKFIARLKP